MKRLTTLTVLLLTIFLVQSAIAGDYNLRGKTKLELNITARDYSEDLDYFDPFDRDNSFDDGQISIGISHFTTENSAVTFMITAAEVSSDTYYDNFGTFTLRSSIVPIFWGSRFYMTDNRGYSPVKPYLAISGTADTVAPIIMTEQGINRLAGTRELVSLVGVTHGFDVASTNDIYTWALTFLDAEVRENPGFMADMVLL